MAIYIGDHIEVTIFGIKRPSDKNQGGCPEEHASARG